ncbi:MAG: hypothetical protein EPO27_00790 [Betaproteobacteria bacterium]|nr:MAG: hypothetical protein EPO27_00790 [Betaproteobacteria bacterium]
MARSKHSAHSYCGQLLYTELEEVIEVSRLIVREKEIAFDLITEWGLGDRWNYSGVAALRKPHVYAVTNLTGRRIIGATRVDETVRCNIAFRIESQSERLVEITGTWSESGDVYAFEGKLKTYVAARPMRSRRH